MLGNISSKVILVDAVGKGVGAIFFSASPLCEYFGSIPVNTINVIMVLT